MKKFLLLIAVAACFFSLTSYVYKEKAHTPKKPLSWLVAGRVTNCDGTLPEPGVFVKYVGTTLGTFTNATGDYSLIVPSNAGALEFSALGYLTSIIPINGRTIINVRVCPFFGREDADGNAIDYEFVDASEE